MKRIIILSMYYLSIFVLFVLYLIGLGVLMTYIFKIIGIPQTEYIQIKQLVMIFTALLLSKVTLFKVIKVVGAKVKSIFE
jgi:hypothetical protein